MRAREPDQVGYVERDGVRVGYEVFGDGEPAIIFLPSWPILHSRQWKAQVPYLARHFRVITFEARGNGRADRPGDGRAATPTARSSPTRSPCWTPSGYRGRVRRAPRWARSTGCRPRPGTRTGCSASWRSAAWRRYVAPSSRGRARSTTSVRRAASPRTAPQPACRTTARSSSSSWARRSPSRTRTKPVEDAVGWGLETDARGAALTVAAREGVDQGGVRGRLPGGALPGAGGARRRGRDHPVRARCGAGRADRRRAGHARGRRPPAVARRPGAVQPADPRVRRRRCARAGSRRARLEPGAAPAPPRARASPRRSGSGTPAATWRSPTSCARCTPTWRSTGWPRTR